MSSSPRLDQAYEAARMYYDEGSTMESIAGALRVSRSTVSRLLRDARSQGLVEISLHPPGAYRIEEQRRRLAERFGVTARVVATEPDASQIQRLETTTATAARALEDMLEPDMIVGLAWGTTLSALVSHLQSRPTPGLRVLQLNGAIDTGGSGLTYVDTMLARAAQRWDAAVQHFPVPAFFDYAATREAMWRERSVQRVLEAQRQCTLAVFSVGAFDADVPSHVYASNYLTSEDRASLQADGAVGDVCTVFLRADGTSHGIGLNARCSGPDHNQLRRIPRRLLVAVGRRKALPLRAALLAGLATDLIIDDVTAASLLALH